MLSSSKHLIHILFSHKYCSIPPSLILDSPSQLSLSTLSFAIPPTLLPVIKDRVKQSETGEQGSPAGKELQLHVPKTYNPEKMSKSTSLHVSNFHFQYDLPRPILHSLSTGSLSAAGRPLCICSQPL